MIERSAVWSAGGWSSNGSAPASATRRASSLYWLTASPWTSRRRQRDESRTDPRPLSYRVVL